MIKVVLHGILKTRFSEMEIDGATPAEVIEGWSRQVGLADVPLDQRPIMEAVGFETEDLLFAKLPDGTTEIHLVPSMFGGGGAAGRILIGAAIMAAVVFSGGTWTPLAIAFFSAGMSIALSGVMQLFMPAPRMDSKSSTDDGSKYINGAVNSTAIGTRIGYGGGRMRVGGQFLSLQVNSSDMVYGTFPTTVPA